VLRLIGYLLGSGEIIPIWERGVNYIIPILYAKFGEDQPLNRQSESYAREGIDLDVSTMADHVGACTATLNPIFELIRRHVLAGQRIHGDDTTVPVLAPGKTITGRLWTYVRDDRPFAGSDRVKPVG
jgi:transposase